MSNRNTLDEFISLSKNEGLSRASHYDVDIITPPKIFKDPGRNVKQIADPLEGKYMMYCKATSLPGTNLLTNEVTTFGENREMPYQRSYDNLNLSFMMDIDLKIKRFFENWMNGIINPVTRVQEYYDNYIATITITINDNASKSSRERLNRTTNERFKLTLYECYPKTIGEMTLSYDSEGFAELPVTMNYKYYKIDPIEDSSKR
jgi:hypothetical protein